MLGVIVSIEGECKMREYVKTVINKKVERTVEDAFSLVTSLVQKGKLIGVGGSMTFKEVRLLDEFQKDDYRFIQT